VSAAERERDRIWTVLELLRWTTDHFAERGIESPRLDAECLLAHALGSDRLRLYVDYEKPVEADERAAFRALVRRRAGERIPVAQLLGQKEFWSLRLRVTPDVLVPRPETETLVAAALEAFPDADAELTILDVGTGSGAVALALASERPKARVTASDLSDAALAVAGHNAEQLGLADRVRFAAGDVYAPVAGERFDLVVSNPPYLAESEAADLAPELEHEPAGALFADEDGLDVLLKLVAGAAEHLNPGGLLALEIAPGQTRKVREACGRAGLQQISVQRDLAGRERVVSARAGGED
jgi:release factor glutamine methyltransferase